MAKIESTTIQQDKRISLDGIGKLKPGQGQGTGQGGGSKGSGQSGQGENKGGKK